MKILFCRICNAMENSKINQRYLSLNISNFVRIGRSMRSSRQNSSATMTTREYLPQPYSPTRNRPLTGAQSPHYSATCSTPSASSLSSSSTVAWTSRSTYTALSLTGRLTRTQLLTPSPQASEYPPQDRIPQTCQLLYP